MTVVCNMRLLLAVAAIALALPAGASRAEDWIVREDAPGSRKCIERASIAKDAGGLASYRWHYFKTSCDAEPAVRFEARVDCTQDMAGDIKVSQRDSLFRQWQEAKALRRSVDWLESRWICGIKDAMEDP